MIVIGFMGCDGSGKTTIASLLVEKLRALGLRVGYRHFNDKFLIGMVYTLLGSDIKTSLDQSFFLEKRRIFQAHSMAVGLDSLSYLFFTKITNAYDVLIWDRYPSSGLAVFERFEQIGLLGKAFYRGFPPPDILIFMDVPTEVAYDRCKETHIYTKSDLEEQRVKLHILSRFMKSKTNVSLHKGDIGINESLSEVFNVVSKDLTKAHLMTLGSDRL